MSLVNVLAQINLGSKKTKESKSPPEERELPGSPRRSRLVHRKVPRCPECDQEMYRSLLEYICEGCGLVEEIVGGDLELGERGGGQEGVSDYNTSSSSAAPVCIVGPNHYLYQKKLMVSTSNYKKQQKRNTLEQMERIIYQYDGPKPPGGIVKQAAEFYYQVQQHCIKRGDVRKGTMAACLYRKCSENNITRKPKEIASIFGIAQSELSNGEKILDELFASGKLGALANLDPSKGVDSNIGTASVHVNQFYFKADEERDAFLSRYFESLGIPETLLFFGKRIVRFTIKYRIAESSIMSSKCAGAVYILSLQLPHLEIDRDQIALACGISKSTFIRFAQAVFNVLRSSEPATRKVRSRLRQVFKRSGVPLQR